MLRLDSISKKFGGVRAVSQVSLELSDGDVLGLIGPNGAGKSTLINLITGLLTPDEGQIYLSNLNITSKKPFERARLGLARTFQNLRIYPNLSVGQNIEVASISSNYSSRTMNFDLDKIITMINMDMIGRMKDSSVTVGGVGTSPLFERLIDSLKVDRSFNLSVSSQGFGPSDHASFYSESIPVLFFFSGVHDDYHTPKDTWKHINLQGTTDIVNLVYDVAYHLTRAPTRPSFKEAGPKQSQRSMGGGLTVHRAT